LALGSAISRPLVEPTSPVVSGFQFAAASRPLVEPTPPIARLVFGSCGARLPAHAQSKTIPEDPSNPWQLNRELCPRLDPRPSQTGEQQSLDRRTTPIQIADLLKPLAGQDRLNVSCNGSGAAMLLPVVRRQRWSHLSAFAQG